MLKKIRLAIDEDSPYLELQKRFRITGETIQANNKRTREKIIITRKEQETKKPNP